VDRGRPLTWAEIGIVQTNGGKRPSSSLYDYLLTTFNIFLNYIHHSRYKSASHHLEAVRWPFQPEASQVQPRDGSSILLRHAAVVLLRCLAAATRFFRIRVVEVRGRGSPMMFPGCRGRSRGGGGPAVAMDCGRDG
jgi:hypothetical protein